MEPLYRIVFTGELLPGMAPQQVIEAFTARFKVQETKAREIILGGGGTVLKHDLDLAHSQKYLDALQQAGLRVVREAQDALTDTDPGTGLSPGIQMAKGNTAAPPATFARPPGAVPAGQDAGDLDPPRGVSAGRGWGWVAEGWALFKDRPWAWIGAILIYLVISIALNLVPFIGGLISTLLGPVFTGGLMIGAHTQYQGGRFEVEHLFAGFSRKPGPLALIALGYLGFIILMVLVIGLGIGAVAALTGPGFLDGIDPSHQDLGDLGPLMLLPVLVALLLGVPLVMAVLFAPALVALNDVPVMGAFKLSFLGCWRNLVPLSVFGLATLALFLAAMLTFGLGLLVVMPVLTIAVYLAYRDIYRPETSSHDQRSGFSIDVLQSLTAGS